ncbi:MAG: MASE1 domain-containing protein [Planctomycetota bacterium]
MTGPLPGLPVREPHLARAWLGLASHSGILFLLALAYYLAGKIGLLMAIPPGVATPVWPPSGIALAAILLLGTRAWPGIWLGSFALNAILLLGISPPATAASLLVAAGIASGSAIQPILGGWLLRRTIGNRDPLARTADVLRFVLLAGALGCMTSATIGVTSVWLGGFAAGADFGANWATWWLGDMAGVMLLTPLFLSWHQRAPLQQPHRWLELVLCFVLVLTVGTLVFTAPATSLLSNRGAGLLLIPFLLWAAFRLGAQESLAVLVVIASLAVWGTVNHKGPFALTTLHESLLLLECFLAVSAITALWVGAAVTERRSEEAALRQVNVELDEAVRERTRELLAANVSLSAEIAERKRADEERRRAEDERHALERALQEAQKLESLGVLAGGIAHDFNNILTGVLGNADLAQRTLPPDSHGHALLAEVIHSTRRAAELCSQMLAYSGRGRRTIERFSLDELVDEVLQLLRASVSKKADLRISLGATLPAVEADRNQMRQVLMNLLLNASEALGDQPGRIQITTGVENVSEARRLALRPAPLARSGDHVFLEVADTGVGMSPETLARIFEPFFTTKFAGRGMGLSAVLGIVRGHHGALDVESQPGRGSRFRLLLPCVDGPVVARAPTGSVPRALRAQGSVLVIDDEPAVRSVCASALRALGFEVLLAADGEEGLAIFRANAGKIVAVILDLTMPRRGGIEILGELRSAGPGIPVVVMSGYDQEESLQRFDRPGPDAFLHKPFTPADLEARLRAVLG